MAEGEKDVILEATTCQPAAVGLAWTPHFHQSWMAAVAGGRVP